MKKELTQENFLQACKNIAPSTIDANFDLYKGEFAVVTKSKKDAVKIANYLSKVSKKQATIEAKHKFGEPTYNEVTDTFELPSKKIGYTTFVKL